jgi:hypothetical protein
MRPSKKQAYACEEKVTLADILVFCVVVLTMVRLIFCFYHLCESLGSETFQYVMEMKEMKSTMLWWEDKSFDRPTVSLPDTRLAFQAPVIVSLCAANIAWSVRKLLLSNDVELNPGPEHEQGKDPVMETDSKAEKGQAANPETRSDTFADILLAIQRQGQLFQSQIETQTKQIQQQGQLFQSQIETQTKQIQQQLEKHSQEQKEQNDVIRSELGAMKIDIKKVSDKCEEINQRCNKMENENCKLSDQVSKVAHDMSNTQFEANEMKEESVRMSGMVEELNEKVGRMNSEIDRLEEFSRRDNLRMFGVHSVSTGERESYDDCCNAVCNVLNSVDDGRDWTEQDIVRAHRVGQARPGEPKPMIVKFAQWRDKMKLITDKEFRGRLESEGVRVANDLTRRQMDLVSEAKREGKAAYFVKGKLTIGPKKADPREYAQVVAGQSTLYPTVAPSNFAHSDHPLSTSLHSPSFQLPSSASRDDVTRSRDSQPERGQLGNPQARGKSQACGHNATGGRSVETRSRAGPPQAVGTNKQQGISGFLRGQPNSGNRPRSASDSRTLRSSTHSAK